MKTKKMRMTKELKEFLSVGGAYHNMSLEIEGALNDPLRKNKEDIRKMQQGGWSYW